MVLMILRVVSLVWSERIYIVQLLCGRRSLQAEDQGLLLCAWSEGKLLQNYTFSESLEQSISHELSEVITWPKMAVSYHKW